MIETKNKISLHQMQILMLFNILGSSLLIFPKLISKSASSSFVFSIILGIVFILTSTFLIIKSLNTKDSKNFNEFFESIFGTFCTKLIFLLFLIKIICSLSMTSEVFVNMTESILLPKTNSNIVLISFLALSAYLCIKGQSVRAKTAQMILYIFLLYLSLFIFISLFKLKTENLPNIFQINSNNLFYGSIVTFFSFSSIIFFFFDYYYIEKKERVLKSSINIILLIGFLFLFITIICISTFTENGVLYLSYPTFDTMNRLSLNQSFITRNEAIVFIFWIFLIFSYIGTCLFYGHLILSKFFNISKINNKYYIITLVITVIILNNLNINSYYLKIIDIYISIFLMTILPTIILLKNKVNYKSNKVMLLILFLPFFLSSCTDKVELEDRRFIYEMYIDKNYDNFVLTYNYPMINSTDSEDLITLKTENKTILGCINDAYMSNENSLDFRQVNTIILSKSLIEDEKMLIEVFNLLSKNNQVGNNTFVISSELEANELLNKELKKETSTSYYLSNFLRNNKNNYITSINFDIDSILLRIRNAQTVILPVITKNDTYSIEGSTVFTDFKFNNFLNLDLTKGYAFLEKNANETPINFNYNNKNIFTKVTDSQRKVTFNENYGKLVVNYRIDVTANFMEDEFNNSKNNINNVLTGLINEKINRMCTDTFNYFNKQNIDGLYLEEKLKKQNLKLYEKYCEDNENFLNELELNIKVNTKLNSTFN